MTWPPQFRRARWRIAATYTLSLGVLGLETAVPLTTGLAIDGLLAKDFTALIPLAAVYLTLTVVGVARQLYDTRLFARMYADVVVDMIDRRQDSSTAVLSGRAALARELVDFLEHDIPGAITSALGCVASLVLLAGYQPAAGGLAALLLVPVTVLSWRFGRRSAEINGALNDAAEREVDVIAERDRTKVRTHFSQIVGLRIQLSDAEARTWGSTEICTMLAAIATLVLLTKEPVVAVGTIYAALAYLFNFARGLDVLPWTVERTVQAFDVVRRFAR
ncbi:ABC transporter six-transmembrane domain-containing protein [Allokutzneria sp. A3M-2-11 16]|uniref:ABC transporter six-transmembrane domain-containing protein n=1 Tax=Allokutzneria sp. A3M-2-11 16 TaxID=2962043 RepID=UPI0020B72095|nr:ABC transporter six-transmembrane domain-containing protein [Allokutzneria sp. A3M-2-11 16]MCP3804591.1 ABC transporter six-transmembrane domain-containing protein [Allokutzneria sp. A3M-2-11 16]